MHLESSVATDLSRARKEKKSKMQVLNVAVSVLICDIFVWQSFVAFTLAAAGK